MKGKASGVSMIVAVLAMANLSFFVPPASAGSNCRSYMWGRGWAVAQSNAKDRARVNWGTRVTFRYGAQYRHWERANSRQYGCNRKSGGWSCTAYGYPCLWP